MDNTTIHYVTVLELEYFADDNDEHKLIAGFELKNERYRLDDTVHINDDYFDGAIPLTYFSFLYIKILDEDTVAVAYVTC